MHHHLERSAGVGVEVVVEISQGGAASRRIGAKRTALQNTCVVYQRREPTQLGHRLCYHPLARARLGQVANGVLTANFFGQCLEGSLVAPGGTDLGALTCEHLRLQHAHGGNQVVA